MGTTMAPNYANLYMGLFEESFVLNADVNPFYSSIISFNRFIDDIFIVWDNTVENLHKFHQYLNSRNDHLRFTLEFSDTQISFLDVLVLKEGDTLQTDLYRKPTDRNTLLRGDSFHPRHLIKSLPISQFHRARRVCSSNEHYKKQAADLTNRFLVRGYKPEWINHASQRFDTVSQEDCLNPPKRVKKSMNAPLCVTKYSPMGFDFRKIMLKHWHVVESDPRLGSVFKEPPKLVFRRPPNLRDLVVHSYVKPNNSNFLSDIPPGNYKCSNCAQCGFTTKCKHFTHPHNGREIAIRGTITCSTTFVVYLIKCPCGLAYVGKTTRALRTRISEHRSNIRCGDERNPVAAHFKKFGHSISSFRYWGIEKVERPFRGGDHGLLLLQREAYYIYTLNTMAPNGLNEEFDLKPFLT